MTMKKSEGKLFLLGSSHQTAPLEIREKIALQKDQIDAFYTHLKKRQELEECLILNTCNRLELYGVSSDPAVQSSMEEVFCQFHGCDRAFFSRYGFWKNDLEVVCHLFEVSAGIDSQMIGETEIFGQVKESYRMAVSKMTVGPLLHHIFQKSFQAAKWVRTSSAISQGRVSIGNVVVDLARRIFGDLTPGRIFVMGTGKVGERTVRSLKSRGAGSITIASRTLPKAEALAREVDGQAVPFDYYQEGLSDFNIVICSAAVPKTLLTHALIARAMKRRPNLPLFLIDLAVPRNIEATAAKLPNVYLYNLDDLAEIVNENLKNRMAEVTRCRAFLQGKAERLWNALV